MKDIRCKSGGFTLIEMSIVIVIVGLLSAAILSAYSIYMQKEQISRTQHNIEAVNDAIASFVAENGYFPCPADPTLPDAQSQVCSTLTGNVVVGVVPVTVQVRDGSWRQLVPGEKAVDGWRSRLTYAVTREMAINPPITALNNPGSIVLDRQGGGAPIDPAARYLVLSHGPDALGAYDVRGNLRSPCAGPSTDTQNCDGFPAAGSPGDPRFVSIGLGGVRSTSGDANNFDDFVMGDGIREGITQCPAGQILRGVNWSTRELRCVSSDMTCGVAGEAFTGVAMDADGNLQPVCSPFAASCPAGQVRVAQVGNDFGICMPNTQGGCPPGQVQVGLLSPVDADGDGKEDTTGKDMTFGGAPDCRSIVDQCSLTQIQVGIETDATGAVKAKCAPRKVGSDCTGTNVMIGINPDGSSLCAPVPTCPNGQYIFGLVGGVLQCSAAVGDSGCGPGQVVTGINNGVVDCGTTSNSLPAAPIRTVVTGTVCPSGWTQESPINIWENPVSLPGGSHISYSESLIVYPTAPPTAQTYSYLPSLVRDTIPPVYPLASVPPGMVFCRSNVEYSTYFDVPPNGGDNCPAGWTRVGFISTPADCGMPDSNGNCQWFYNENRARCAK